MSPMERQRQPEEGSVEYLWMFNKQNEAVAEARRKNNGAVRDVDPDSGEEIEDAPVEDHEPVEA